MGPSEENNLTVELVHELELLTPRLNAVKKAINRALIKIRYIEQKLIPGGNDNLVEVIKKEVLMYYSVGMEDIMSKSRESTITQARQVLAVLLKSKTSLSYAAVGLIINRDHATIMHSVKVIGDSKDTDDIAFKRYAIIEKNIDNVVLTLDIQE